MAKAKSAAAASSDDFLATLNELNKVANRTNIASVQAKGMAKSRGGAAAKGGVGAEAMNVCAVYGKARPVLELIVRLPFIPAKAKEIVRTLMSLLDIMCPR